MRAIFAGLFLLAFAGAAFSQAQNARLSQQQVQTPQASEEKPNQVSPPENQQVSQWVQLATGVAWPVSLVLVVLLFAFHPRLNRLFGLTKAIRKIKAAGVEMEINADAVDAVRAQLRASTEELVEKAKDEYDRMAKVMRISEHLENVIVGALPRVLKENGVSENPPDVRGTIHVHDIVISEYLYQLVDYFPTRRGAGRRFPQRYGIIGRSWRLSQSLGEGDAFESGKGEERILIEEWGMTREDVRSRGKNQPAYLSVILNGLKENEFANGILYIDSTKAKAFGGDDVATKIALELEKSEEVIALRGALEKLLQPLRVAAPNLDIRRLSE